MAAGITRRFPARPNVIALQTPTAKTCFKIRIGCIIRPDPVWQHFDIVNQAFAHIQQADLNAIDAGIEIRAEIKHAGRLDVCPRGFAGFVTVSPVAGESMVAARIDQFKTAAAAIGPLAPAPARGISHLIHYDPCDVRLCDAGSVGVNDLVWHRQSQPLSSAGQFAAEISQGVVRIEIGVMREEVGDVVRDHKITARRDRCVGREDVVDSRDKLPAADIDRAGSLVVQLNVSVVGVASNRFIHDFVDDDVTHENAAVRKPWRPVVQWIKLIRSVRVTPRWNAVFLALKFHGVEHPRSVRCFEVDRLTHSAEAEAQLVFVEIDEPASRDDGVGRDDEEVGEGMIAEDATG